MKAIVTIIDDDGRVIERNKVIKPYDAMRVDAPKDCVPLRVTHFRFDVMECLYDVQISGK